MTGPTSAELIEKAHTTLEYLALATIQHDVSVIEHIAKEIRGLLERAGVDTTATGATTGQSWDERIEKAVVEACLRSAEAELEYLALTTIQHDVSVIEHIAKKIRGLLERAGVDTTATDATTEQSWDERINQTVVEACLKSARAKLENLQNTPPNHARAIQYEAKQIHELLEVAGIDATAKDAKTGLSWTQRINQTVVEACLKSARAGIKALETTPFSVDPLMIRNQVREIRGLFQAAAELRPVDPQIAAQEAEAQARVAAVFIRHGIRGPG